ncbi:MAG: peptide-methionine (S)-S-oxide reductase MsrA [archaeon]
MTPKTSSKTELATFGAGCFWGVEELYRTTPGVTRTQVGFMGGRTKNPSYEAVCYLFTGHAEVVHIEFDPKKVSYATLLELFWNNHNPTTLNRQGLDIGSQYRSVIFYHSEKQHEEAEASKTELEKSGKWKNKIVTQIVPAEEFYAAEEYHQKYLMKKNLKSCHV